MNASRFPVAPSGAMALSIIVGLHELPMSLNMWNLHVTEANASSCRFSGLGAALWICRHSLILVHVTPRNATYPQFRGSSARDLIDTYRIRRSRERIYNIPSLQAKNLWLSLMPVSFRHLTLSNHPRKMGISDLTTLHHHQYTSQSLSVKFCYCSCPLFSQSRA